MPIRKKNLYEANIEKIEYLKIYIYHCSRDIMELFCVYLQELNGSLRKKTQ